MRRNKTKEKLLAGQPVFGFSTRHLWMDALEMAGELGFDFVILDCEHGRMGEETGERAIKAIDLFGMTPIVRVRGIDEGAFLGYLEAGALGILLPHINTKEDLRRAKDYIKFYPEGQRGLTRGRPIDMTGSMADFIRDYNRETMIAVIIEDIVGVNNLSQLLTVDGVDAYTVGPYDLAQTMGYIGGGDHPEVVKTVEKVLADVKAAGKNSGLAFGATGSTVKEWLARGCRFIFTSTDGLFTEGGRRFMQVVKGG